METVASSRSTLRESFLASDHAENNPIQRNFTGIRLADVLNDESKSARTLFDVIRMEETPSNQQTGRTTWKTIKERLRLRRNNNSNADRVDDGDRIQRSGGMRLFDALDAERETVRVLSSEPGRMSLMEVLELESGSPAGFPGPENESDEEEDENGGGLMAGMACCVCMVRRKGAAFIPCGHTFCRMCSRELWVQRGSCPLCNGSILEVLDIF